jgi:hypothetical protein
MTPHAFNDNSLCMGTLVFGVFSVRSPWPFALGN